MAGLVGDDADQLAGMIGFHDQAGVEEQIKPLGDEGVQTSIFDQMDLNRIWIDASLLEQWRGVDANGIFDFRIPD